jgi:hypothetical protein
MLLGCATSSHVMIGTARPPISPESVRVYVQPPEKYEEIAAIDATSQGSFAITSQQNMDKAIAPSSYRRTGRAIATIMVLKRPNDTLIASPSWAASR